jgi:enamine deaminase RidA (YjgF/YER057c/UK114 family)
MFRASLAVIGLWVVSAGALAADAKWPVVIPAPNGEVILASEGEKRAYDEYRYSAARRVDNMLYLSGVVFGRADKEGKDVAAFKQQVRRGFERIKATLQASGADFSNVVMVNSFHVWQGPNFEGTRDQQFDAFYEVAGDYFKAPYPAWTAVGTSGLLADGGIVEVQLVVRLPK